MIKKKVINKKNLNFEWPITSECWVGFQTNGTKTH